LGNGGGGGREEKKKGEFLIHSKEIRGNNARKNKPPKKRDHPSNTGRIVRWFKLAGKGGVRLDTKWGRGEKKNHA